MIETKKATNGKCCCFCTFNYGDDDIARENSFFLVLV